MPSYTAPSSPGGGPYYGTAFMGDVVLDKSQNATSAYPITRLSGLGTAVTPFVANGDLVCHNLTINAGTYIDMQDDIIFCTGTLTVNGVILTSGPGSASPIANGNIGQAGGTGVGVAAVSPTPPNANSGAWPGLLKVETGAGWFCLGGDAGAGGSGTSGAGGAAAYGYVTNAGANDFPESWGSGLTDAWRFLFTRQINHSSAPAPRYGIQEFGVMGGVGGASGAGDGTNNGGAGGIGGGVLPIFARYITGTGLIQANGGNGFAAAAGNCGGGGGGGGGIILLTSSSVAMRRTPGSPMWGFQTASQANPNANPPDPENPPWVLSYTPILGAPLTFQANGGAGGAGHGTGQAGQAGTAGMTLLYPG